MRKLTGSIIKCIICFKEFYVHKYRIKEGKAKFCSRKCHDIFMKIDPKHKIMKKGFKPPSFWLGKKRPPFSAECRKKMSISRRGSKGSNWNGGKFINDGGYIYIHSPNHPFREHHGYVREHRLIVEKQIGRYLMPTEKVHHLDEIRNNNNPKNLMAFVSNSAHIRFHKNPNNVKPEEIIFDGRKLPLETT